MYKYFTLLALISSMACSQITNNEQIINNIQFQPNNHSKITDQHIGQVIQTYQELIKGLSSKDTLYMRQAANQMIKITDSMQNIALTLDTNTQKIWVDGMGNINAEIQGLQFALTDNNFTEIQMSANMCALQILNLLAQVGYKEHQIYIFNTKNDQSDDGFTWFSFQKTSRDPFHSDNRKEVQAVEILQEMK